MRFVRCVVLVVVALKMCCRLASSALKAEGALFSQTSVNFFQAARL
jgi:hypothetical protein